MRAAIENKVSVAISNEVHCEQKGREEDAIITTQSGHICQTFKCHLSTCTVKSAKHSN